MYFEVEPTGVADGLHVWYKGWKGSRIVPGILLEQLGDSCCHVVGRELVDGHLGMNADLGVTSIIYVIFKV